MTTTDLITAYEGLLFWIPLLAACYYLARYKTDRQFYTRLALVALLLSPHAQTRIGDHVEPLLCRHWEGQQIHRVVDRVYSVLQTRPSDRPTDHYTKRWIVDPRLIGNNGYPFVEVPRDRDASGKVRTYARIASTRGPNGPEGPAYAGFRFTPESRYAIEHEDSSPLPLWLLNIRLHEVRVRDTRTGEILATDRTFERERRNILFPRSGSYWRCDERRRDGPYFVLRTLRPAPLPTRTAPRWLR